MSLLRIKKPSTRKGKKALLDREPKTIENAKKTLIMEGRKCSNDIRLALKDLNQLKKPNVKVLKKNYDISPFEDASTIERISQKSDSHLFIFGSSSKKRPNNLVFGRMYDEQILDMIELGITQFKSLNDFKNEKIGSCVKPLIIFNGYKWKLTEELRRLKSLIFDMFQKETIDTIRLQGVEHVLSFTITEDLTILMRSYKIHLKKSGLRTPRIELTEIGPSMDLVIRRTKIGSDDLYKLSLKQPAILKVAKRKNVTRDELGNVHGRVHIDKQNISALQTRKMKGLRKTVAEKKAKRKLKKKQSDDIDNGMEVDSADE
uniref:Ribosome production factor 2 homolog n=1 Tax=Corethrella appendiculata TaxID=1370023 RepID=U5EX67_9DIPT